MKAIALLSLLAISACSEPPPTVRWFGALHAIMHEGRTGAAVQLSQVVPGPHAWGVGALAGLQGEITIVDDALWLATPQGDGQALVRRAEAKGASAALLVVANVEAWTEHVLDRDVGWSELDHYLGSLAAPDRITPLRIVGAVRGLHWHVVDGSKLVPGSSHAEHARTAVTGALDEGEAQLIGFFSRQHQGVFTHAGSHSHFHVLLDAPARSGHVDRVSLPRGTRILVPRP